MQNANAPLSFKYINLDYLNLMSDNDPAMKKIMLEMLLEELPEEITKMKTLSNSKNWDELGKVSHKMKSTLAFVGFDDMTETNKRLEFVTKHGTDVHEVQQLMNQMQDGFDKVHPELVSAFNRL